MPKRKIGALDKTAVAVDEIGEGTKRSAIEVAKKTAPATEYSRSSREGPTSIGQSSISGEAGEGSDTDVKVGGNHEGSKCSSDDEAGENAMSETRPPTRDRPTTPQACAEQPPSQVMFSNVNHPCARNSRMPPYVYDKDWTNLHDD